MTSAAAPGWPVGWVRRFRFTPVWWWPDRSQEPAPTRAQAWRAAAPVGTPGRPRGDQAGRGRAGRLGEGPGAAAVAGPRTPGARVGGGGGGGATPPAVTPPPPAP